MGDACMLMVEACLHTNSGGWIHVGEGCIWDLVGSDSCQSSNFRTNPWILMEYGVGSWGAITQGCTCMPVARATQTQSH
jgi:hypothetical protein